MRNLLADAVLPGGRDQGKDSRMQSVDPVKNLAVLDFFLPHERMVGVLAGDGFAPMAVDGPRDSLVFFAMRMRSSRNASGGTARDLRTLMSQAKSSSFVKSS